MPTSRFCVAHKVENTLDIRLFTFQNDALEVARMRIARVSEEERTVSDSVAVARRYIRSLDDMAKFTEKHQVMYSCLRMLPRPLNFREDGLTMCATAANRQVAYSEDVQKRRLAACYLVAESSFRVDGMEAMREGTVEQWAVGYMAKLDEEDSKHNVALGVAIVSPPALFSDIVVLTINKTIGAGAMSLVGAPIGGGLLGAAAYHTVRSLWNRGGA